MNSVFKRQPVPFGKYLLLDRINIGGMAEVWRAKDWQTARLVAIKRILPTIAEDEEFLHMFLDEARITVQLAHPNIARVLDLGNISNAYFMAMEYVSGKDLRSLFDRAVAAQTLVPLPFTVHALALACDALDYAHRSKDSLGREMNVVHRDVSPQNVLLGYDGEVKVIDFGIAKAANKATKTQAGILKGKFGYMSPEQVRGLPLDRRSDIFAMGVCLYELLTGERLFKGESDFSVLEKVRAVDVLPPVKHNPKIPEELNRIVMKSLEREVEDRYAYASDVAVDLRAAMKKLGWNFGAAEVAAYMRSTFAEDAETERQRQLEFARMGTPSDSQPGLLGHRADTVAGAAPAAPPGPTTEAMSSVPLAGPGALANAGVASAVATSKSVPTVTKTESPSVGAPRDVLVAPPSAGTRPLTNPFEAEATALGPPSAEETATGRPPSTSPAVDSVSNTDEDSDIQTVSEGKRTSNKPPPTDQARTAAVPPEPDDDVDTGVTVPGNRIWGLPRAVVAATGGALLLMLLVTAFYVGRGGSHGPMGVLVIDLPPDIALSARVSVNGVPVTDAKGRAITEWPHAHRVPAGQNVVSVMVDGYEPFLETATVTQPAYAIVRPVLKKR